MKRFVNPSLLLVLLIQVFAGISRAQAPKSFKYQSVARNTSGSLVVNSNIGLRLSIHDLNSGGAIIYRETHTATSNAFGAFTLTVGGGSVVSGSFATIAWGVGLKYIEIEADFTGGSSYASMGSSQLLSVPYALYADNGLPKGSAAGSTLFWDGTQWIVSGNSMFSDGTHVGINTAAPDNSAILDLTSSNKGFLPPRMTTAQRDAITSPANGLIIYNTTTQCLDVWNQVSWSSFCQGACIPPPTAANAGSDFLSSATIITVQGNSPSAGIGLWTIQSGAGGNLASPTQATTNFAGIAGNTYVLAWTITNACGISSDLVNISFCQTGFSDCNGINQDGCEVNLSTSATNCGACGLVCAAYPHTASASCANGVCVRGPCSPGFGDCDGNPNNGCETDLNSPSSCGACGMVCASYPNTLPGQCSNGNCVRGPCVPGYSDCDGNPSNGCETNLQSSTSSCSGCGITCSTAHMASVDCVNGNCTGNCVSGFADCDGNRQINGCETDINNSLNNCGGCGFTCSSNHIPNRTCNNGACTGACAAGFADCNGNKQTDGCEVNLMNDVNNCGACGSTCNFQNGTGTCSSGACVILSCLPGYFDCDGNPSNGCEHLGPC